MAPTLLAGVIPASTAAVAAGCLLAVAAVAVFIYVIFLCVGSKNKDGSGKSKKKKNEDAEIQAVEYNDESSKTTTTSEVRVQKEVGGGGGGAKTLLQSYSNESYSGPEALPRLTTDHNMNVALPSLEGEAVINVPAGNIILVDGNRQDGILFNSIESDNDEVQQIIPSGVTKGDRIVSVTILMENMDLDDARNILEFAWTYPVRLNVRRPDGLYQNVVVHAAHDADVASPPAKISGGGGGMPSGGLAVRPEVGLNGRTNLGFSGADVDVPEPAAGLDGDLRMAQSRFGNSLQLNEGVEMADEDYANVRPSYQLNADGAGGKLSGLRASEGNDVDAEGDFDTGFGVRRPKFGSDVGVKEIDLKAPTADFKAGGISVGGSGDAKMPSGKLDAGFDEPTVELGDYDYEKDRVKVDHSLGMGSSGMWNGRFDIDELADEDYVNLKAPSHKLNAGGAGGTLPGLRASADMEDVDLNLPRGGINTKLPSGQGTAGLPEADVHVGGTVTSPKVAEPKLEISKEPTSPTGYVKAAPLNVSVSSPKEPHELVVSQMSPSYDVKAGSKKPSKLKALFKKDQEKIQMEPVQLHPVVTPDVTADLNSSLVGVSADWPHKNLDVECEADADAMAGIHPIELEGEDEELHMRAPRLSFSQDEEVDVDLSGAGAHLPHASIEQPDIKLGANAEGAGRLGGDYGLSGTPTADISVSGPDAKAKGKTKPLFPGLFGKGKKEKISVQAPTITADMKAPKIDTGARADLGVIDVDSSKPSFQFDAPKASITGDIGEGDIDGEMDFDGHLKTKTPGLDLPKPANIDVDVERPNFLAGVTQPDVPIETNCEIAGGDFGADVNADIEAHGLRLSGKPASPQLPDAKVKAGKGKPLFAGLFGDKKGDKKISVDARTAHLTTPEFDASCISLPSGSPNMNVDVSRDHVQSDEDFGADFDAKLRGLSNFGADIEEPDVNLDVAAPDISADISGPAADLSGPNVDLPETGVGVGGKRFGGVGADIDADLPTGAARFGLNPEGDLNLAAPELDLNAGGDRDIKADVEAPSLHLEGKAVSPQPPDLKLKGSAGGKGKPLFAGLFGGKEKKADKNIHLDAPTLSAEGKSPKLQGTFDIPSRGVETDMNHGAGLSAKLPGLSDFGGEFDVEPPEFDADVDGTTRSGKMAAPSVQLAASTFDLPEPGVEVGGRGTEFGLKQDVDLSANAPKFNSDLRQDIGADIEAPSLNLKGRHDVSAPDVHVKGKGKPLFAGLFSAKEQKKINVEAPTADARYSKLSGNVGLPSANVEADMEHGGGFNAKLPDLTHVGGEFDAEPPELGADVEARNAAGRFVAPEVEFAAPAVDVDADLNGVDIDTPSLNIGGKHAVSPPDSHVKGKGKPQFAGLFDRKEKQINVDAPILSADVKSPKLSGNVGLPSGGIKTDHGVSGQFEVESPEFDGEVEAPTIDLPDTGNIGALGADFNAVKISGNKGVKFGADVDVEPESLDLKTGGLNGQLSNIGAKENLPIPEINAEIDKPTLDADLGAGVRATKPAYKFNPPDAKISGEQFGLKPETVLTANAPKFDADVDGGMRADIVAPSMNVENNHAVSPPAAHVKGKGKSFFPGIFGSKDKKADKKVSIDTPSLSSEIKAPNTPESVGFDVPYKSPDLDVSAGHGDFGADFDAVLPNFDGEPLEFGFPEPPELDVDGAIDLPGSAGFGGMNDGNISADMPRKSGAVILGSPHVDLEMPGKFGTGADIGEGVEVTKSTIEIGKLDSDVSLTPPNVNSNIGASGDLGASMEAPNLRLKSPKVKQTAPQPAPNVNVKASTEGKGKPLFSGLFGGKGKKDKHIDVEVPTVSADVKSSLDADAGLPTVDAKKVLGIDYNTGKEFVVKGPQLSGDVSPKSAEFDIPDVGGDGGLDFKLGKPEAKLASDANFELPSNELGIHVPSLTGADVSLPSAKTGHTADMPAMSADSDLHMPQLKTSGPHVGGGSGIIGLPGADFNAGKISGNKGVKLGADVDAELESLDLKTDGLSGQLPSITAKESLQLPEIDAEIDKPTLDADLGAGVRATKPAYKFGSPDAKLSGGLDDANLNLNRPSSDVRIDTSKISPDMKLLGSDAGGKFEAKAGGGSDLSFSPGVSLKGAKTVDVSDVNADASLQAVSPQADIHAAKKKHGFFGGLFSGKKDKKKDKHLSYQAPEVSAEINPPDTRKNIRMSLPETTLSGMTAPTGGVESQLPKAKLDIDATDKSSFDGPQVGMKAPHVSLGGKQLGGEADVKLDQPDLKSAVTLQRPHTDIDLPSGEIDVGGLKGQKYGVDTSLDGSADVRGGLPEGSASTGFEALTLSRTETPYIDLDTETEHGRFSFPDADLKAGKVDMNTSGKAKLGTDTKFGAPFSGDYDDPKVEGNIAGRLPTADIDIGQTSLKTGAGIGVGSVGFGLSDSDANRELPSLAIGGTVPSADKRISADMQTGKLGFSKTVKHPEVEVGGGLPNASVDLTGPTVDGKGKQPKLKTKGEIAAPEVDVRAGEKKKGSFFSNLFSNKGKKKGKMNVEVPDLNADAAEVSHELNVGTNFGMKTDVKPELNVDAGHLNTELPDADANMVTTNSEMDLSLPDISGIGKLDTTNRGFGTEINPPNIGHTTKFEKPLAGVSTTGVLPSVSADADMSSFGMKGKPGIDTTFDKPSLDFGSDVGGGVKLGGTGGLPGLSAKGGVPSVGADVEVPSFGVKGKPGIDANFDKPSLDVGSDVGGGVKFGGTGGLPGLSAKGGVSSVGADLDVPSFGVSGKPGIDAMFDKPSLDVGSDVGGGINLGGARGLPGLSAKGGVPSVGADLDVPSFGVKGKPGIDAKFDKPSLDVGSDVGGGVKLGGTGGLPGLSAKGGVPSVGADVEVPSFGVKGKPGIDAKFDKPSLDVGSDVGGGINLGGAGGLPGLSAKGGVPSVGADLDVPSFGMKGKPGIDAKFDKPSLDFGSDVGGGVKLGGTGGLPGLSAKGGVPSVGADVEVPSFGVKGKPGIDAKFDKPSLDVGSDVGGGVKLGGTGGLPGLSAKGGVPSVGADVEVPSFGVKGKPGIDAKFDKPSLDVGSDVGGGINLGGARGLHGLSAKGGVPSVGADLDVPSFGVKRKPGIDANFDKPSLDVGSDVGGGIKLGGAGGLPGLSAKGGVPSVGADLDVPSFGVKGKPGIDAKFDRPSLDVGSDVGGGIKLGGAGGLPDLSAKGGVPVPSVGADVGVPSFGMKGKPGIDAKFDKPSLDVGSDVGGGIKLGGTGGLPGLSTKDVPSVGADVDVPSFGVKGKPGIDAKLEKPSFDVGSDVGGGVAFGKSDLSSRAGELDAAVSVPSANVAMKEPKKKSFLGGLFKSKSKKSGQIEADVSPVKVPDVHVSSDVRRPQVSLGETRPLSGEFGLRSAAPNAGAAGAIEVDASSINKRASVGLDRPNIKAETSHITTPDLQIGGGRGRDGSVGLSEGGKLNAGLTPMDVSLKKNVDLSHDIGMSLQPPTIEQHTDLQNFDAGLKVGGTGDFPSMPTKGSGNVPSFGFKGKDEMGASAALDKPSVDVSAGDRSLGLGPKFSGDAGKVKLSGDRVSKTVELPTIGQQAGIEFGNLEMSPDFEDTEFTSDIPRGQVQAAASLPSASVSTKDTKKMGAGLDGKQSYKFGSPSPKLTGELGDASLSGSSSPPTVDVHGGKSAEVDTHKKGGFSFGNWFGGKKREKSADLNAGLPGATVDKNAQIHATLPGAEMQPVSLDKQGSLGGHVALPQPDLNASLEPSFSHETSTKVSLPTVRAEVDSPSGKLAAPSVDMNGGKPADVGVHKKGGLSFDGLFGNKKHNKSADLSVGLPEASTDNKSKLDVSLPDAELPSVSLDKQGSLGGHLMAPKSNLDSSRELSFSHDTSAKVPMPAATAEIESPSGKLAAPSLDIRGDKSSDLDVHKTGGRSFGAVLGKSNGEKSADLNVSSPRANFSNNGQLDAALPEAELPSVSVGKHGSVGRKAEFPKPDLDTEFKGDVAMPSVKVASHSADVHVDESTDAEVHKKGGFSLGGMFGGKKHEKSADLNVPLPETNIDKRSSVGGRVDIPKPELGAGLSRDTSSKISLPTVEADVNSSTGKITAPSIDVHGGKSADISVSKKEGLFGGIFGGKKHDVSAGFNTNLPESSVDGDGEFHATLPKAEWPSASVSSVESAEGRAEIRKPTLDASLAPGAVPDGYGKVSLPNLTTDFDVPSIRAREDQTVDGGVHRKGGPDGLSISIEKRTEDLDVALPEARAPSLAAGKHGSAGGFLEIEKPTFGASFGSTDVRGTKIDATAPTARVSAPSADIGLSSETDATRFGGFGKSKSVDVPDVNLRTQSRSVRTMGATVDMGDESSFGFVRPSDLDVENKRAGDITTATSGTRFSHKSVLRSQPEVESTGSDLSFGITGVNYERQARNAEASGYRDTVALDTKSPEVEGKVDDGVFIGNQSRKIAVGSRRESGSAEVGWETEKRRVSSGVLGRRQSSGRSGLDIRPGDIEKAVVGLGTRETKADIEAYEYDSQNLSTNNRVKSTAIRTQDTSKGSDFEVDRVEETIVSPVERTIQVKTVKTTTYTVTRDADEEEDEETYDLDQRPLKTTVTYRAVEGEQLGNDEEEAEEDADEDDVASLESGQFYFNAGDSMDLNAEAMIKQIGFHPIKFPDSTQRPIHNGDDEDEDTQEEDDVEDSIEDPESRLSASDPRSTAHAVRSSDPDSKVTVRQSAHSSYTVTSLSSAPTSGASTSGGCIGDLSRFALTPVDLPSDDETNEADMTLTPTVDDIDEPVDTVTSPQMVTSQLTVRLSNGSGATQTRTEEKRSREIVFLRSGTSSTTTTLRSRGVTTTTTEKRTDDVNNNLRDAEFASDA